MEARQTSFRGGPVAGTGLRTAAAVGLLAAFLTLLTASDARAQEPAADLSDLTSGAAQTVANAGAAESPAPAPASAPVSVNPADVVPAPVPAAPDPPSVSTPPVQTNAPVADRVSDSVSGLAKSRASADAPAIPSIGSITAAAEQTGRKVDRLVSTISAAASAPIGAAIDDSLPLIGPALAPTLQSALSAVGIDETLDLGTGVLAPVLNGLKEAVRPLQGLAVPPSPAALPVPPIGPGPGAPWSPPAPPQTSLPGASSTSLALHFPSPRTGPLALLTPTPSSSFGVAPVAAGDEKPSPPPIAPPPTAPSPSGSPSGSSGPIFIPLAALTVLVALLAPALLRRLREGPGIPVPTPFVCALERPG